MDTQPTASVPPNPNHMTSPVEGDGSRGSWISEQPKRRFVATMTSEVECPTTKYQAIDPEHAGVLDEEGYFVDEPIPEPMDIDEGSSISGQSQGVIRNPPLVARRKSKAAFSGSVQVIPQDSLMQDSFPVNSGVGK